MNGMKKDGATWNRSRRRHGDLESRVTEGKNHNECITSEPVCQPRLIHSRPTPYGGVGVWLYPDGAFCVAAYTFQNQFYGTVRTRCAPFALKEEERIRQHEVRRWKKELFNAPLMGPVVAGHY